jgi:hypothetical protein
MEKQETQVIKNDFVCDCGEADHDLLIIIDNRAICENCVQILINKLRKTLMKTKENIKERFENQLKKMGSFYTTKKPMSCEGCENKDIDPHLADCLECSRGAKDNYSPKQSDSKECDCEIKNECELIPEHCTVKSDSQEWHKVYIDNIGILKIPVVVCPIVSRNRCTGVCECCDFFKGTGTDDKGPFVKCAYQKEV